MVFNYHRASSYYQDFLEVSAEMFETSTENVQIFLGVLIGLAFLVPMVKLLWIVVTTVAQLIHNLTVFVMEIVKMWFMVLLVIITYEVAARALGWGSTGLIKYWSEHLPVSLEIKFRNFDEK